MIMIVFDYGGETIFRKSLKMFLNECPFLWAAVKKAAHAASRSELCIIACSGTSYRRPFRFCRSPTSLRVFRLRRSRRRTPNIH